MTEIARVFNSGCGETVRFPVAYRFDRDQVFIRPDPETGDVNLSARSRRWGGLLEPDARGACALRTEVKASAAEIRAWISEGRR